MSKLAFTALLGLLLWQSCFQMDNKFAGLPPGPWRAVLQLQENPTDQNKEKSKPFSIPQFEIEDVMPGELPFNFEVVYEDNNTFHIDIINGDERIRVDARDISFGRNKARARDTIRINFPVFDSYIIGEFAGNTIQGSWIVLNRNNYSIPFTAVQGKSYRFTTVQKATPFDMSGKWKATFGLDTDEPYPAVGEFVQDGNRLTGTFMTETGDYRFLEGTIQEDHAWLSCFDGSHSFLFEIKVLAEDKIMGAFYNGKHFKTTWEATKDESAELAHTDSLTFLKPGYNSVSFAFENPDGKVISLDNPEYKGKVKIVQIMGTWCPNCWDETRFLVDYLNTNSHPNLAVIALAFERHTTKEKANEVIRTYKKRFGMSYEVVHAGLADKQKANEVLPMLNHVLSYPTMIFLDANNKVVKIHTGFNGPATSKYEEFKEDFNSFVRKLVQDKPLG